MARKQKNKIRTTCARGHKVVVTAASGWHFGSAVDFCDRHPRGEAETCEARIVLREVKVGGRWCPIRPEWNEPRVLFITG